MEKPLCKIAEVTVWVNEDQSHVRWVAGMQICNDGRGPSHNDPHYQPQTAYYNKGKFLHADHDCYIVIPPQVRKALKAKVMGAKARLTHSVTGATFLAVCGEIGPRNKIGEAAYCLAKKLNPQITHNSGDHHHDYLYELWPGVKAEVDGKIYPLE